MSSSSLGKANPVHPRAPVVTDFQGKVIIAPIVATDIAQKLFADPKKGLDVDFNEQISVDALKSSKFFLGLDDNTKTKLLVMLGGLGYKETGLSMAFPHMSPNNNNTLFWKRFARYFIMNRNQGAAKEPG